MTANGIDLSSSLSTSPETQFPTPLALKHSLARTKADSIARDARVEDGHSDRITRLVAPRRLGTANESPGWLNLDDFVLRPVSKKGSGSLNGGVRGAFRFGSTYWL